MKSAGLP